MVHRHLRAFLLATAVLAGPASADTLREALAKAYRTNPTLTGARAEQRATDQGVPIARARGLPSVGATAQYTEDFVRSSLNFTSPARSTAAGVNLSVPIYAGGAVRNGIKAADARVSAGLANLRDTEATVFSNVVAAYMDVIRDQAIVSLNIQNLNVLKINLEATRDRFQVGDLTRTDVAQSQARLSGARSQLESAQATLIGSRETYVRLVGEPAVNLEPPPPLPNLPVSPDTAVTVALDNNPGLLAAQRRRDAARFETSVARASRAPKISAVTGGNYSNYLGSLTSAGSGVNLPQVSKTAQAGIQVSIPLYQGGLPTAQVRQAQALESQSIEQTIEVERSIVAQTRAAYASWRASNELIISSQSAVDANTLSLEGVRAENSVGNRTILDILNAEQELLNSQVNLVSARRNSYVAGFSLLAAMGQAEARNLGLESGALYDPTINYRRVRNDIWDFHDDPKPSAVATRTVDTPAQTPSVMGPTQP
ncbi:TolC family outer membrane protein [Sphingomonas sp.]|uniref:TolC family outer membrane protein n=1 Tax=Sphingomonas sp. TaxID=28214 RepID=UPI0025F3EF18|nr:TolC family outer membrane protein [Sphingomonas sp.]